MIAFIRLAIAWSIWLPIGLVCECLIIDSCVFPGIVWLVIPATMLAILAGGIGGCPEYAILFCITLLRKILPPLCCIIIDYRAIDPICCPSIGLVCESIIDWWGYTFNGFATVVNSTWLPVTAVFLLQQHHAGQYLAQHPSYCPCMADWRTELALPGHSHWQSLSLQPGGCTMRSVTTCETPKFWEGSSIGSGAGAWKCAECICCWKCGLNFFGISLGSYWISKQRRWLTWREEGWFAIAMAEGKLISANILNLIFTYDVNINSNIDKLIPKLEIEFIKLSNCRNLYNHYFASLRNFVKMGSPSG